MNKYIFVCLFSLVFSFVCRLSDWVFGLSVVFRFILIRFEVDYFPVFRHILKTSLT